VAIERRQRRRRNGETYVVCRVRWTTETGVKRYSTVDTERDAKDFEARLRLLRRSDDLASLDAGRETLAEFVQEWWQLEASARLERATLLGYASHWNRHALPRLAHPHLRQITPLVLTSFRADLERDGLDQGTIRRTLVLPQTSSPAPWSDSSSGPTWSGRFASPGRCAGEPSSRSRPRASRRSDGTCSIAATRRRPAGVAARLRRVAARDAPAV
jgi:hypothetical protein